jgi:hypothetical protein
VNPELSPYEAQELDRLTDEYRLAQTGLVIGMRAGIRLGLRRAVRLISECSDWAEAMEVLEKELAE